MINYNENPDFDPTFGLQTSESQDARRHEGNAEHHPFKGAPRDQVKIRRAERDERHAASEAMAQDLEAFNADESVWDNEGGASAAAPSNPTADKLPMPYTGEVGNDLPPVPRRGTDSALPNLTDRDLVRESLREQDNEGAPFIACA